MSQIEILQAAGGGLPRFLVRREARPLRANPVLVPSPFEWPVPGAGTPALMAQLEWYLETFIQHPYEPYTFRAAIIEAALEGWGRAASSALFEADAADLPGPRIEGGLLDVVVTCHDPHLLAWPWEALCSPSVGFMGHGARIRRRMDAEVPDSPSPTPFPTSGINILLVTSRPYGNDVAYGSVSRPLVDLLRREKLGAALKILRPPTFDALLAHLQASPGKYHILHFDGHGTYSADAHVPDSSSSHQGRLIFEKPDGSADEVSAERLAVALRGAGIPFAILNACRSGRLDGNAARGSAFASVSGALVKAGFRGVLAMAYNLNVQGAVAFMPSFYKALLTTADLPEATRRGRLKMFDRAERSPNNPTLRLQDWLLPVVYQQSGGSGLERTPGDARQDPPLPLPSEPLGFEDRPFIGRDSHLHRLERALRRQAACVLVHGLSGIGKTALAANLLLWLRDTGGLAEEPAWHDFRTVHSASYVIDSVGRKVLGSNFDCTDAQQFDALIARLRERSLVIVWDNFEAVAGTNLDRGRPFLAAKDRSLISDFVLRLAGGSTRIIAVSRSSETWLPDALCSRLPVSGLKGVELWEYVASVLADLDVPASPITADLRDIVAAAQGHPILVRALLAQLQHVPPALLAIECRRDVHGVAAGSPDPSGALLHAQLNLAMARLLAEFPTEIAAISMHERFLNIEYLHGMGRQAVPGYSGRRMDCVINELTTAGLLTAHRGDAFALHPLLESYLQSQLAAPDYRERMAPWRAALVDLMSSLADRLTLRPLVEKRWILDLHMANMRRALESALELRMDEEANSLVQLLGSHAMQSGDLDQAEAHYAFLLSEADRTRSPELRACAHHQLGVIAAHRRSSGEARAHYLEALSLALDADDSVGAGRTFFQIGRLAEEDGALEQARDSYFKALASKTADDHGGQARVHDQLGHSALAALDFKGAESEFRLALDLWTNERNLSGVAATCHHLGLLAQEMREFEQAEEWYGRSIEVKESLGDDSGLAKSYHQMGRVCEFRRRFQEAEGWYLRALDVFERLKDLESAATVYQQLGYIARESGDLNVSERWLSRAIGISEQLEDPRGRAVGYHQMAILSLEKGSIEGAEAWVARSMAIDLRRGDRRGAARCEHLLGIISQRRRDFEISEEHFRNAFRIYDELDDRHGVAMTFAQMSRLGVDSGDFLNAGRCSIRAFLGFVGTKDDYNAWGALSDLAAIFRSAPTSVRDELRVAGESAFGGTIMANVERKARER